MTGAIIYVSEEEFDADYKELIASEIASLAEDHVWWKESVGLVDEPAEPDTLEGATRLTHRVFEGDGGKRRKIDYRDDVYLGMVDYSYIVGILAALSNEHEFSWNLYYPASPQPKLIGSIVEGRIDPKVFEFLIDEMKALEISDADLEDESLQKKVRSKYFTAKGERIFG